MARLRIADTYEGDAVHTADLPPMDEQPNSPHDDITIAKSAFDSAQNLAQPIAQHITSDGSSMKTTNVNASKALICKKMSPRKDARKQIHLKPMNFAKLEEDLSILTISKDEKEVRRHQPRDIYSPIKLAAARLPSNSSIESMISDNDDGSDFSLPVSLDSDFSTFNIGAKIPESLLSPTRRKLFSPSKQKPVTDADLDEVALAFATTKLDETISTFDAGLDGSIDEPCPESLEQPHFQMPKLLPSTWTRERSIPQQRPVTPPLSPSKTKLVSPSKTKLRIPTPPNRSSPNGFWSVEKVNDWNDQHSPKKIVRSPKKSHLLQLDASSSPSGSPTKRYSPSKPSAESMARTKEFESRKKDIALAFLAELDSKITDGQIAKITEPTGGVHLNWSRTLNSTAGRANWKRETPKSREGQESIPESKQFASIDLAEKVIDNEERLLNVLAHEFCHLANFMVSGIKDRPHGAEFKAWGRKCTLAFGDRGVEVTTKHSYEIDYKYVWVCTNEDCQTEFKRHSKSIDPTRESCGACRSPLLQIRPVPRKAAPASGYGGFVKEHYAAVKNDMPGAAQKEIMAEIGRRYRAAKEETQASHQASTTVEVDLVAHEVETIVLDG